MPDASISILMATYKRAPQLDRTLESIAMQTRFPHEIVVVEDGNDDNGATRAACDKWKQLLPIRYFQRLDRPNVKFSNPAIPKNIAIQKSTGDILIVQCSEVRYLLPNDLENLIRPVEQNSEVASYARCCGTNYYDMKLDFCMAVRREHVLRIGGFEERFVGSGNEDGEFFYRLEAAGLRTVWAPGVLVEHQRHERINGPTEGLEEDKRLFFCLCELIRQGLRRSANENREWGVLR